MSGKTYRGIALALCLALSAAGCGAGSSTAEDTAVAETAAAEETGTQETAGGAAGTTEQEETGTAETAEAEEAAAMTAGTETVEADEEKDLWEIAEDAYLYAFPLVIMHATEEVSTNTVSVQTGRAPVNQFNHAKELADASFRTVVTPNVDTVYSQAWLDIGEEPVIYVMPEADRFFTMQLLDAWTNTAAVLSGAGTYAITLPGYDGELPEGATRVEVPTSTVWMIGRIVLSGQEDLPNVYAIQDQMALYPLSAWEDRDSYTPPEGSYSEDRDYVPSQKVLSMDMKTFFDTANALMDTDVPAEDDLDLLDEISAIGVGPGMTFDETVFGEDRDARWQQMLGGLRGKLEEAGLTYAKELGQWRYYGEPIGDFGTAYTYRALVALAGLGANTVDVAIYPKTETDADGDALTGEKTCILHFDSLPPVKDGGFWSVTAYGDDDFLIDNPIDRYCINDRSAFTENADGSVDIVLSKEAPENEDNWLPVSDGAYHLYMRIYLPDMEALDSWQAPEIRVQ